MEIIQKIEQQLSVGKSLSINSMYMDYKSEVIAAGLIEWGLSSEKLHILRLGNNARNYSKDIERISMEYISDTKHVNIYTHKAGFYDILPEGMFHKSKISPLHKSKKEILAEMQKQQKEEDRARLFFRPFEISLSNMLINAQLYERKLDKKYTNENYVGIFCHIWSVLSLLPLDKAVLFIELLPLITNLNLHYNVISEVFSAILGIPVTVTKGGLSRFNVNKELLPQLGKMKLCVNSVIGQSFSNGHQDITIGIGPLSEEEILFYKGNPNGIKIIRFITSMLLPADCNLRFKFHPLDGTSKFTISSDKKKASKIAVNSYL